MIYELNFWQSVWLLSGMVGLAVYVWAAVGNLRALERVGFILLAGGFIGFFLNTARAFG